MKNVLSNNKGGATAGLLIALWIWSTLVMAAHNADMADKTTGEPVEISQGE